MFSNAPSYSPLTLFWYNTEWKLSCLPSFFLNMKSQLLFGFFVFCQLQLYHFGAAFSIVFIDFAALLLLFYCNVISLLFRSVGLVSYMPFQPVTQLFAAAPFPLPLFQQSRTVPLLPNRLSPNQSISVHPLLFDQQQYRLHSPYH